MITFQNLVNISPQISDKLIDLKIAAGITAIVIVAAIFVYLFISVYNYIQDEHIRRKTAPWISIMKSQPNSQLSKDLGKLHKDSRLPNSYMGAIAEDLDERYKMVDDFVRICRKRKIKVNV